MDKENTPVNSRVMINLRKWTLRLKCPLERSRKSRQKVKCFWVSKSCGDE